MGAVWAFTENEGYHNITEKDMARYMELAVCLHGAIPVRDPVYEPQEPLQLIHPTGKVRFGPNA